MLVVKLSDIYARKPLAIVGLTFHLVSYTCIVFFIRSLYELYAYVFLMGLGSGINLCIFYNYEMEMFPINKKITMTMVGITLRATSRIV